MMKEKIYRRLAEHLDRLPGGFPPSETDADLRLLERLFTLEEAKLAVHLTLDRETAEVIAGRADLPLAEVESRLGEMAEKGLIFALRTQEGSFVYQAMPMVVGIYEMQIKDLSPELLDDFHAHWSSIKERPQVETIPQMRTIPVGESIEHHPEALPYEQVTQLVNAHERFAVTTCICRHSAKMRGEGCNAPEENCLIFGDWADYTVRTGRSRSINRSEVMAILAESDAANLVLQPSNSREIEFICSCCGCCCGILWGLKNHPHPAEAVASAFIAQLDTEACEGCWTCLDRCQMDALEEDINHVILKTERCIGCGLCVTTCPSGALSLTRKPESRLTSVPDTMDATWQTIVQDQAKLRS
jgi:ferredoxin